MQVDNSLTTGMGVYSSNLYKGAFTLGTKAKHPLAPNTGFAGNGANLAFAASRSSVIYGNSNTVTPLSESCLICIHY